MAQFEKLDSILVLDLFGDLWNDDFALLATDILNDFTPADWEILNTSWHTKKERIQKISEKSPIKRRVLADLVRKISPA